MLGVKDVIFGEGPALDKFTLSETGYEQDASDPPRKGQTQKTMGKLFEIVAYPPPVNLDCDYEPNNVEAGFKDVVAKRQEILSR